MLRWLALCAFVGACYHPPEPDCGFVCGSGGACPPDYTCVASDQRCHRAGAPLDLVCTADAMPDAPVDARPDGVSDAAIDAGIDAAIDAAHADAAPSDATPSG